MSYFVRSWFEHSPSFMFSSWPSHLLPILELPSTLGGFNKHFHINPYWAPDLYSQLSPGNNQRNPIDLSTWVSPTYNPSPFPVPNFPPFFAILYSFKWCTIRQRENWVIIHSSLPAALLSTPPPGLAEFTLMYPESVCSSFCPCHQPSPELLISHSHPGSPTT